MCEGQYDWLVNYEGVLVDDKKLGIHKPISIAGRRLGNDGSLISGCVTDRWRRSQKMTRGNLNSPMSDSTYMTSNICSSVNMLVDIQSASHDLPS